MELNVFEKTVLVELSKSGFIGNWYLAFGKKKLRIYTKDPSLYDSIIISFIGFTDIEVTGEFRLNFNEYEERDKKMLAFQQAIEIVSSEYSETKFPK